MADYVTIKEGGFVFRQRSGETTAYKGKKCLGKIIPMLEASGRYCFYLECDSRDEPRTYRGRIKAAQALQTIDALKAAAKKGRWSTEELIVRSWDIKPSSVLRV